MTPDFDHKDLHGVLEGGIHRLEEFSCDPEAEDRGAKANRKRFRSSTKCMMREFRKPGSRAKLITKLTFWLCTGKARATIRYEFAHYHLEAFNAGHCRRHTRTSSRNSVTLEFFDCPPLMDGPVTAARTASMTSTTEDPRVLIARLRRFGA